MARSNLLVALVLLAGLAAACGGSNAEAPTPTATTLPTAMPLPTESSTFTGAPTGLSKLTFIDPQHGWAIGACPKARGSPAPCDILATDDGGRTWRTQYHSFDSTVLRELQFLDAQHGFVTATFPVGSDTIIFATTDGGATWKERGGTRMQLDEIQFVSPQLGYAIEDGSGVIFRTSDGGDSWVFAYGSPECRFHEIDFAIAEEGWAGGEGVDGPCLYRTTDGGKSWSVSFSGAESDPVANAFADFVNPDGGRDQSDLIGQVDGNCGLSQIRFVNATEAWLVIGCRSYFSGGLAVLSTSNAGKTWRYIWGQTSCLMNCNMMTLGYSPVFFLDDVHVWRFGPGEHGVTVQASADAGLTWAEPEGLGEKCCYGISSAFFVDAAHGWFVTGDETLDVTTDGGLTWSPLEITIEQ